MRKIVFVFIVLLFATVTLAQGEAPAVPAQASGELVVVALTALGMALNTGGVFFLVGLVNWWKPKLKEKAPHWIPILAMLAGPVLNGLGTILSNAIGFDVDFSPLIGAFAGPAAVAFVQVHRQKRRISKTAGRLPA